MKKIALLLAILMMMSAMLVACSNNNENDDTDETKDTTIVEDETGSDTNTDTTVAETTTEEITTEEITTEKITTEETTADVTTADETTTDETTADETTADETTADETTADETTADETTADKTTADETTEEVTTEEVTTEEITTEEITTEEITTEEITTEEVTTEEETLDELSAAIKECNDILADSKMLYDTMLVYYDELMGNVTTIPGVITYSQVLDKYNNYKNAIETYEMYLPNAQYKDSYDKYKAVEEYANYRDSEDAEEQALYQEYLEVKSLYKNEHDLYVKYEKALSKRNDTLQNHLIPYMQMFLNQEIDCGDSRILKVKDILSIAEELENRIYNAHSFVEIIAKYEGDTIVYAEGEMKCVFNIVDTNINSDVTRNAIMSVIIARDNMYLTSFLENNTEKEFLEHDTSNKTQNFASYDENGNIPDPDNKESYYVLFDDGVKFDADGNDISEIDIAFTGTSIANYRYFEIIDVTDKTFKGDGANGTVKNRWYYTLTLNGQKVTVQAINYNGGRVVLVPIGEKQVTDTIYRNIKNTGEWCYYSKDTNGNIDYYYLRSDDGVFTKVIVAEYEGYAVAPEGVTVKVLKNENGEMMTDANGNPIYVSGTDYNNFTTYREGDSASQNCNEIIEMFKQLINDMAALGDITAEELSKLVYND